MVKPTSELGPLDQQMMLAIMKLQPRAYGVSIQKHICDATDRIYSTGAIYAALDRLEAKGYLESRQGEPTPERGGRRKLYFTLTAPGQVALQQSLRAVDALRRGIRWTEAIA